MTLNHTTRGYFEAKLFNVSKALKAYSDELSRKAYTLHKPITQACAIKSDNKLSVFMCMSQFLNINNMFFVVFVVFPNARCAASVSKMKKGSGSSSEKAKPLKYLHVTSVQLELQLTINEPAKHHYQLCRDKAVFGNPYWVLRVPDSVVHM